MSSLLSMAHELLTKPGVSDLHIEADAHPWTRTNGRMRSEMAYPIPTEEEVLAFAELVSGESREELMARFNKRGDADYSGQVNGLRIRGNLWRSYTGKSLLAMRRLAESIPDFDSLKVPYQVREMALRSKGLVLVTGPTGSGKSTTLASLISYLNNNRAAHIITVEDPVEYVHVSKRSKVVQREVGRNKLTDFKTALRAALREDPDVILIGEMRDRETISTALDAAQTGHLVFGTLHTVNARQSVDRITSAFEGSERDWVQQSLAAVLVGICSQVLLEKQDGGRQVACEVMVNNSSIAHLIKEGKIGQIANVMDTGRSTGQLLLNHTLVEMVLKGVISKDEALYNSYDPAGLERDLAEALGGY